MANSLVDVTELSELAKVAESGRSSRDGSEIFYRQGNGRFAVAIETDSGFKPGPPKLLFEWEQMAGAGSGLVGFANMDVSPDGKTFVMVEGEAPVREFHVVLNWIEELNRL